MEWRERPKEWEKAHLWHPLTPMKDWLASEPSRI